MSTTETDLTPEQRARASALRVARVALTSGGPMNASKVEPTDLHSIAVFILDGGDPWLLDVCEGGAAESDDKPDETEELRTKINALEDGVETLTEKRREAEAEAKRLRQEVRQLQEMNQRLDTLRITAERTAAELRTELRSAGDLKVRAELGERVAADRAGAFASKAADEKRARLEAERQRDEVARSVLDEVERRFVTGSPDAPYHPASPLSSHVHLLRQIIGEVRP